MKSSFGRLFATACIRGEVTKGTEPCDSLINKMCLLNTKRNDNQLYGAACPLKDDVPLTVQGNFEMSSSVDTEKHSLWLNNLQAVYGAELTALTPGYNQMGATSETLRV